MKSFICILGFFAAFVLVYCSEQHLRNLDRIIKEKKEECNRETPLYNTDEITKCPGLCAGKKLGFYENKKFQVDRFLKFMNPDIFNHTSVPFWKSHLVQCTVEANKLNTECDVEYELSQCLMRFSHPTHQPENNLQSIEN